MWPPLSVQSLAWNKMLRFNKFTTIFRDSPKALIDYVKLISQVIAA